MTGKELIALMENPSLLNEETLPHLACLLDEYPYFQTARMLYVKNLSHLKDSAYASELKKMALYTGDRKQMFYLLSGNHFVVLRSALENEKDLSVGKSFELIDSFLKNLGEENSGDYLSEIPQKGYTLPNDAGGTDNVLLKGTDIIDHFLENHQKNTVKISLEEPEDENEIESESDSPEDAQFFTETLAKIYIKQQKYDKALEIIRKLSLLYPEKSIYFADQIRFLEKLITNIKK